MRALRPHAAWTATFPLLLAVSLASVLGCGAIPHVMYWMHGVPVKARFGELQRRRVAVVCVANEQTFGDSGVSDQLARLVAAHLRKEVKEIEVVHENEVAQWIDTSGWDRVRYADVGQGVKADMVVGIDLASFRTDAGNHLFQGRADYTIKVFDMGLDGQLVYRREENEFTFPRGGHPASGGSPRTFTRLFLQVLARDIAKDFYDYQLTDDFAEDAAYLAE